MSVKWLGAACSLCVGGNLRLTFGILRECTVGHLKDYLMYTIFIVKDVVKSLRKDHRKMLERGTNVSH